MTIRAEVVETVVPIVPIPLNHYAVLYWMVTYKVWACHTLTDSRETADRVRNYLMNHGDPALINHGDPVKIVHITETPSSFCHEHHKDLAEKERVEPPDEVVAGMQGVEAKT